MNAKMVTACTICREPIDYTFPGWDGNLVVGPGTKAHRQCYVRWLRGRASVARKLGRVAAEIWLTLPLAGAAFGIGLVGAGILVVFYNMVVR